MEKAFHLRWARGDQARFHAEGEWQLRFRDGAAHEFAKKRLKLEEWQSRQNTASDETIYTFHRTANFADPFANLLAAGLPEGEIEMGTCAECDKPATEVREKIEPDGAVIPWPLCTEHSKQFDDMAESLLGPDPSSE